MKKWQIFQQMQWRLSRFFSRNTLFVFVCMMLLSESVGVTADAKSLKLAQQPTATPQNINSDAQAKQLLQEADKLFEQGTAASRQQALGKYLEVLKIWQKLGDGQQHPHSDRQNEATTLFSIGTIYYIQRDNQQALEYFNQALAIRRELKDRLGVPVLLQSIGNAYANLGEKQKALSSYNQALSLFQAEKQASTAATTLVSIGRVYFSLGETQKALDSYNQALLIQRTEKDFNGQAETLQIIGQLYTQLGEPQKALEVLNQALEIHRTRQDLAGQADTLTIIATLYNSLGETQKALESFSLVLDLQQKSPQLNPGSQAVTFMSLGGTYLAVGDYQKGLDYFNQALVLWQKLGNRFGEAEVLSQISFLYDKLGQKQKALDSLNQGLVLQRANKNRNREAFTLGNIAAIYESLGDYQQALDFYNQALTLQRQVSDRLEAANTISYIAKLYSALGDYKLSIETYNQALDVFRKIGDGTKVAQTLDNIGSVYRTTQDYPKSLEYYNQALKLWQEQGAVFQEFTTLTGIIRVYESLKDYPQALDVANQALALSRKQQSSFSEASALALLGRVYQASGDYRKAFLFSQQSVSRFQTLGIPVAEANVLGNIAKAYNSLKQPQPAIEHYNQELKIRRKLGDRTGVAATQYKIAVTERDRGNFNAARTQIEATIKIVEDIRTKVTSQELRTAYFATVQDYYQFYIDLLMQLDKQQPAKGYAALALQTSERARARSLLELLTEANADIRQGVAPKLLSQERDLQQQLDALEKRQIELLTGKYTEAQSQALKKESEVLLEQYRQVQTQIRATSPRYAALTQPQPLTLAEIQQQVLDDDTLLLEYSLGTERSYLWAVTNKGITSYELPKRADIEAAVQKFRQAITTPYRKNSPAFDALSQIILAPVAEQLGQKRLVIVSDGALQYVPFTALTIPKSQKSGSYEPLLLNHEIISLPSASTLAVLRGEHKGRKPAPKTLAVLADPIFSGDDERLQGKRPLAPTKGSLDSLALNRSARDANINFARLQFTRQEAEQILSFVPISDRKPAFDFTASRTTATSNELSQYRIVHFATHGILNSKQPELSGVVLSLFDNQGKPQNGFLRLHDVFNLNLPAELVVLSACQTGLGEEVKGEGLVGLTRGFMYAGSSRVVVSLWSVDDQATSELMKVFYQKMLQEKLKPAVALRSAQIEMWRHQNYAAPYYWAAFTLQGEWR
ncbi:hypothetical protein Cylst_2375 [Cylindrospermum stagnale PCC 7417]|uniref:CHAT domain-containing protein n=1 Tax=Cylindrospermum stagnale PCC 7417 TaxID=56107 RepID=K9WXQ7_9NOST|nr:tetratricopeptide repeat protein [Cylindrospermum stagnale]AFZ24599.1 hypothetical protein Cylst_2375 [Cylindrospermum stagnale PCC 7417]